MSGLGSGLQCMGEGLPVEGPCLRDCYGPVLSTHGEPRRGTQLEEQRAHPSMWPDAVKDFGLHSKSNRKQLEFAK